MAANKRYGPGKKTRVVSFSLSQVTIDQMSYLTSKYFPDGKSALIKFAISVLFDHIKDKEVRL